MDFEPEKFFIGVIDLFSILMPGAVLSYYTYRRVPSRVMGLDHWTVHGAEGWVVFLFTSYLLGHFLFFVGSWLDDFVYDFLRKRTTKEQITRILNGRKISSTIVRSLVWVCFKENADRTYERALTIRASYLKRISAPKEAINTFQWCKARLALEHREALAAVNRFEADSKFFRSFVPVMFMVIVAEIVLHRGAWKLWSLLAALAMILSFLRYMEQRFKSTQQAYWFVITLEANKLPASEATFSVEPHPEVKAASLTHAGGVVFRKKGSQLQFLMLQATSDPTDWVLPKGHIEAGEDPRYSSVREVREETGMWAKIVMKLGSVEYIVSNKPVKVMYYLMKPVGEGRRQDILRERKWLSLSEVENRGLTKYETTLDTLKSADKQVRMLEQQ